MKPINYRKFINELFYLYLLPPEKEAKYWLIQRYEDKVSPRLIKEADLILKEGKLAWDKAAINQIIYGNPLLDLIKKEESWQGAYIPVPIVYK